MAKFVAQRRADNFDELQAQVNALMQKRFDLFFYSSLDEKERDAKVEEIERRIDRIREKQWI